MVASSRVIHSGLKRRDLKSIPERSPLRITRERIDGYYEESAAVWLISVRLRSETDRSFIMS
jgi:hypothetical protein